MSFTYHENGSGYALGATTCSLSTSTPTKLYLMVVSVNFVEDANDSVTITLTDNYFGGGGTGWVLCREGNGTDDSWVPVKYYKQKLFYRIFGSIDMSGNTVTATVTGGSAGTVSMEYILYSATGAITFSTAQGATGISTAPNPNGNVPAVATNLIVTTLWAHHETLNSIVSGLAAGFAARINATADGSWAVQGLGTKVITTGTSQAAGWTMSDDAYWANNAAVFSEAAVGGSTDGSHWFNYLQAEGAM